MRGEGGLTICVECLRLADARPNDGDQVHRRRDRAHAVINVTIRRPPVDGRDPECILDELLRPAELSDDLLRRLRRHVRVAPRVDRNLVASHVLVLEDGRALEQPRADGEECSAKILLREILQQVRRIRRRAVVIGDSPRVLGWALGDVRVARAATARPPAVLRRVSDCGSVVRARPGVRGRDVRDVDTRGRDFLDPLLHLGRVSWGCDIELGVIRRDGQT